MNCFIFANFSYIVINDLRYDFGFQRGGEGNKTFVSKQFLARGGKVIEGVRVVELNSTYHWKSIPETSFTVAIVVPVGDSKRSLDKQTISPGTEILFCATI